MDVSKMLNRAWKVVDDANLPKEVQPVAFQEAIRLLYPMPSAPAPDAPRTGKSGDTGTSGSNKTAANAETDLGVSEDEIYKRVVAQSGVARDKLEQVVHLDGNMLKVSIPGLKLGNNNAERARAVAQILTITRGFGIEESETPLAIIRAECDRLRVYDQNNFSSHMKALTGYVITGSGQNRRVRAKGPGIAAFPGLVDSVLGDS